MKRWEYLTLDFSSAHPYEAPEAIRDAGRQGWELVQIISAEDLDGYTLGATAWMKREISRED